MEILFDLISLGKLSNRVLVRQVPLANNSIPIARYPPIKSTLGLDVTSLKALSQKLFALSTTCVYCPALRLYWLQ